MSAAREGPPRVAVIGGGVVGASVALALTRHGAEVVLLEACHALALGASGTNSGILHTGFDAAPGSLEARLMLRAAELRPDVIRAIGVPFVQTGAVVRAPHEDEQGDMAELVERARQNGVQVIPREDGSLVVPDESITDPVAYTLALASAAARLGAKVICDAPVESIAPEEDALSVNFRGEVLRSDLAVNCAGLFADEVARAAGDDHFRIVPRKGEFFVFAPPSGIQLEQILLPLPSAGTKGVLVFPTVDGMIIAGPTARDQADKRDWSVRPGAREEVVSGAIALLPELAGLEPVASYAGLRPAGAVGVNYLIDWSAACPRLLHVAAIRSTGLSSSLAIGEHVAGMITAAGFELGARRALERGAGDKQLEPWWRRAARRSAPPD